MSLKKSDPLTTEEVQEAADAFFPLFTIVQSQMPEGSSVEDALKVMENVAKLAHKNRSEKLLKNRQNFGFNGKTNV